MLPFLVLASALLLSLFISRLITGKWKFTLSGNVAMSCLLVFAVVGHFMYPVGMAMMLPAFIPFKVAIIYVTGFIELAAAIGLLLPAWRYITSILLILFLIFILPANVYAAIHEVDLTTATHSGPGLPYLWFRIPLQLFFIIWVWYFGIHRPAKLRRESRTQLAVSSH
ncbi:MAG: hypothetical protein H7Y42_15865 [Chitinophagaceae bacterium]|nr:hypothetical protein [Chitinophagaceae bacterium]